MNKNFIIFCVIMCPLFGCEDVVDVNLPEEEPKLVIDATGIQFEHKTEGIMTLRLSTTAPLFADQVPIVRNAEADIQVDGETYPLAETKKAKGTYSGIIPMIYNKDYTLNITVEGQTYQGTTQLYATVPIDYVEQSDNGIDPDETSINAYFTDPAKEENYYYFGFISKYGKAQNNIDDQLIDGNQVSTFYADEFEPGDELTIIINGISKRCNTYFSILNAQTGTSANPFATAPSTIRGNMVNLTAPDDFPLGYFRISQQFQKEYTIQ